MAAALCYDCGTSYDTLDNYCRSCGASLRVRRLPAAFPERRLARLQSALIATAVGKGVVAVIGAKALSWGARFVIKRAVRSLVASKTRALTATQPARQAEPAQVVEAAAGAYTVATLTLKHEYVGDPAPAPKRKRRWLSLVR